MRWPSLTATEHQEQTAVIQWANAMRASIPELTLLFAVPNGGQRPRIKLCKRGGTVTFSPEGLRLNQEGVKAGVPDLFLPVARNRYHGLFIEIKRVGGSTSLEQDFWIKALSIQEYCVRVCHGADAAIKTITEYLSFREQ